MNSILKSFYSTTSVLNIFKHSINDLQGKEILTVKTKVGIQTKFYFYDNDNSLVYYGIHTLPKKLVISRFEIYDQEDKMIAVVSEKMVHEKTQLFKEYKISVGEKEYDVRYTIAHKKIIIKELETNRVCVECKLISSIFKNLIEMRKYIVDIYDSELDLNLWVVIIKGIRELE